MAFINRDPKLCTLTELYPDRPDVRYIRQHGRTHAQVQMHILSLTTHTQWGGGGGGGGGSYTKKRENRMAKQMSQLRRNRMVFFFFLNTVTEHWPI